MDTNARQSPDTPETVLPMLDRERCPQPGWRITALIILSTLLPDEPEEVQKQIIRAFIKTAKEDSYPLVREWARYMIDLILGKADKTKFPRHPNQQETDFPG